MEIARTRSKRVIDADKKLRDAFPHLGVTDQMVPGQALEHFVGANLDGLLPECLISDYHFWRVSESLIRAYPVGDQRGVGADLENNKRKRLTEDK